jgi:uncharacterized repeat protein (TIGR02543 family)
MLKKVFLFLLSVSLFISCDNLTQDSTAFSEVEKIVSSEIVKADAKYTVKFVLNLSGVMESSIVNAPAGYKLDKPDDPIYPGYAFVGWFINEDKQWDFDNDIVYGDIVLLARFDYVVTFDLLDGSEPTTQVVSYLSYATKPALPSRDGYAFLGWYSDEQLALEWRFRFYTVARPLTLYAKWTDQFHVVTFDTNDNWIFSVNVPYGSVVDIPEAPVDPNNTKLFESWTTDNDDDVYNFDSIVESDFTLYAAWIPAHLVSFDIGVAGYSVSDVLVRDDDAVSPPALPVIDGLDFYMWVDNSGTMYDFRLPVISNLSLRAVYLVTLTFDSQGGGAIPSQTVARGGNVVNPASPSKKIGYNFGGWYTKPIGGEQFNFIAPLYSHATVYARWDVTISFDTKSNNIIEDQRIQEGTIASVPNPPSRHGYTFAGWYTAVNTPILDDPDDITYSVEYSEFDFSEPVTSNQKLYARYLVTVTFAFAGGGTFAEYSLFEGSIFSYADFMASSSVRALYIQGVSNNVFDDWYTHPTSGVIFDFSKPVSQSVLLYARWGVELTFNAGSGGSINGHNTLTYPVKMDALISQPAVPTKTGHDFIGWWTMSGGNGYLWDFATYKITESTTLYAGWTPRLITISLELLTRDEIDYNYGVDKSIEHGDDLSDPIYADSYITHSEAWINGGQGSYSYYYGDDASFSIISYLIQRYPPYLKHYASDPSSSISFSKWCYDLEHTSAVNFDSLNSRSFTDSVAFYAARDRYQTVSFQYRKATIDNRIENYLVVTQIVHVKSGGLVPLPDFKYAKYPTIFSMIKGFYIDNENHKWDFQQDRVSKNVVLRAFYEAGWGNGTTDDWYRR